MRVLKSSLIVLALVAATALSATAASQSFSDPDEATGGMMDIKTVTHADDATNITYTYEAWTDFTWDYDNGWLRWVLDFDNDNEEDAYVFAGQLDEDDPDGTPPVCKVGRIDPPRIRDCTISTAGRIVTLTVPKAELTELGLTGNSYEYAVRAEYDPEATTFDRAPDATGTDNDTEDNFATTYTHTLGTTGTTTTSTTLVGPTTTTVATTTSTTTSVTRTKPGTVSDNTVSPGQQVRITGDGYAANRDLSVALNSTPISMGTVRSSSTGTYNALVTIPRNATPGAHTITVTGAAADGTTLITQAAVTVGGLARTGDDASRPIAIGAMFVVLGVALVFAAEGLRRRVRGAHFLN
jgi:hypothetical protein